MKSLHPDINVNALIVFNISMFIMIVFTFVIYYIVFDEAIDHQQKLNQSMFISFFTSITIGGIISNKYMRKRKEKINDKNIS